MHSPIAMEKKWIPYSVSLTIFIIVAMKARLLLAAEETTAVPAIFIFGDSTVDVGTNDFLPYTDRQAKADNVFYGIDFRGSLPTGRFSNGFNTADLIGRLLGYKRSPPAFLYVVNKRMPFLKRDILQGANFASGGSGILNTTGYHFGKVISLEEQIEQFVTVRNNISEVMGSSSAAEDLISRSLFLISVGSNDIMEYFFASKSTEFTIHDFMTLLIYNYQIHLENLLNLGAKKFGIISVPPVGCCPRLRSLNKTGGCIEELNGYAQMFYKDVQFLLQKLSSEFRGMKYSLANAYEMTFDIIENPFLFGIKEAKEACCGKGRFNGEYPCNQTANLCQNRNDYLFWDMFHPTQAGSRLAALTHYAGSTQFVQPINLSQLVKLA